MPRHTRAELSRKPKALPRHAPASRKQPPRESHALITQLLHLQRTAGNAAVSGMLHQHATANRSQPVLQRLMSAEALKNVAGQPKADRTIRGKVLYRMSQLYKAVLSALENYRSYIIYNNVPDDAGVRKSQIEDLKERLDAVIAAGNAYLRKHTQGSKAPHISQVVQDATSEKQLLPLVDQEPAFYSDPDKRYKWREALDPMMRVQALQQSGELQQNLYHGSSSKLLGKFKGELLSGKELEKRGVVRDTGEGDFFSRHKNKEGKAVMGGGEKDFVSVGQGTPGIGTAAAYAIAASDARGYNLERYNDTDLLHEFTQLQQILANWDEQLNKVPEDDIMGARREKIQFQGLYNKLKAEVDLRANLPNNHPRRLGQSFSESAYPLLFEFDAGGLDISNPQPMLTLQDDTASPRAIGGERQVKGSVDLRDPARLKRVYCPLANMGEVRAKLTNIVQHSNFEVVPLEALKALGSGATEHTQQLTIEVVADQYDKIRRMVLEAYSEGMAHGSAVDKYALFNAAKRINL